MARVTVWETHIVDGIPTTIKANHAYCLFCAYTASNHRAGNNHVRMHFQAIMVCGWPGCYFVHMQSLRMIEHSSEVHGMARAKPSREKGGDWGPEYRSVSSPGDSGTDAATNQVPFLKIPSSTGTPDVYSSQWRMKYSSFIQYYSRSILLVFIAFNHVYRLVLVFYKLEFQSFISI